MENMMTASLLLQNLGVPFTRSPADSRFLGKGRYRLYLRYVYNGRKFVSDLNKEIILE